MSFRLSPSVQYARMSITLTAEALWNQLKGMILWDFGTSQFQVYLKILHPPVYK